MAVEMNYTETNGPNTDAFLKGSAALACFVPICPYSFMANRPFLQEYLPWVLIRCSKAIIIIGDFLERHNIMAFHRVSEAEAISKAGKQGRKIKRTIESVLSNIKIKATVVLDSCRHEIESAECRKIAQTIREYCDQNSLFRTDIEEQTHLMLKGSKRAPVRQIPLIDTATMNHFREYMIEELALYILLYQRGYTTEIYPGRDIKILRSLALRQYRDFPYDFSERTHISLAVLLDSGISYARLDDNNATEGE